MHIFRINNILKLLIILSLPLFFASCQKPKTTEKTLKSPIINEQEDKDVPISKSEDNMTIDTDFPPVPVSE